MTYRLQPNDHMVTPDPFELRIVCGNREPFYINSDISPQTTFGELSRKIAEKLDEKNPDDLQIVYSGKKIGRDKNDKTLEQLGI